MNILQAAVEILQQAGEALAVEELCKRILASGLWSTTGKTPQATLSARIYTEIKQNGATSVFVKVGKAQVFGLRSYGCTTTPHKPIAAQHVAVVSAAAGKASQVAQHSAVPAKRSRRRRSAPSFTQGPCPAILHDEEPAIYGLPPQGEPMPFLKAAELVLDLFADKQPMHYRAITEKALQMGWLNTQGKTPDATMNAQLVTQLKLNKLSGEEAIFERPLPGHYALSKWQGEAVSIDAQITSNNREVKQQLLARLMQLDPIKFEQLICQLLSEMGFESVEATKAAGDGGIDVRGIMLVGGVMRIKTAVQVKRWKSNVQAPTVQQVRGSLGAHEQGLIITTSDYSVGAQQEANQADKVPVALMNGKQLVNLLVEYNIGVTRHSHELYQLNHLAAED